MFIFLTIIMKSLGIMSFFMYKQPIIIDNKSFIDQDFKNFELILLRRLFDNGTELSSSHILKHEGEERSGSLSLSLYLSR